MLQLNQLAIDGALSHLRTVDRDSVKNQLTILENLLTPTCEITISGATLTITSSEFQTLTSDGAYGTTNREKIGITPIANKYSSVAASTVNFTSGAVTGAFAAPTGLAMTNGHYVAVGLELRTDGMWYMIFGTPQAVKADTLLAANTPVFTPSAIIKRAVLVIQKNGAGLWNFMNPVYTDLIVMPLGGGGSGGAEPVGSGVDVSSDILDNLYYFRMKDYFTDSPSLPNPSVDIGTNKTDATTYDSSNQLYRLSYDASKTVTGTGTAMTISATPSFTVKAGDILVVGTEAKRITVVTTQTSYTIESAFTLDPSSSVCCISQVVYTLDLNQTAFDGVSAYSQLADALSEVMVNYHDSATSGDIIPDWGTAAHVGFTASANGTAWTDVTLRPTNITDQLNSTGFDTTGTNLYLRFFAYKTSGSGGVNLLDYTVWWQKQSGQLAGSSYLTAYARPSAAVYQNVSHTVVSGKSRFTFDQPYGMGLLAGEAHGSALEVFANGQKLPRYSAGVTDTTGFFTELTDTTIEMDTDYSAAEMMFRVPTTVIDSNTNNTTRLTVLEEVLANTGLEIVARPLIDVPYTTIVGRAQIPDLANDLGTRGPVDRIMIQNTFEIQNESGASGQKVFGVVGDKDGLVRVVSSAGGGPYNNTQGQFIQLSADEFVEISFYGTRLHLLVGGTSSARTMLVTVDGGSEGVTTITPQTSSILEGRGYSQNIVVEATTSLTSAIHTVKIRSSGGSSCYIYGFEILNESSTLNCRPGTYYSKGSKYTKLAASTLPFKPASYVGTKGACVVNYIDANGTLGQAFTEVPSSPLYGSSANHTNEEVIATRYIRQMGCGRADDFSTVVGTPTNRAFTSDDGTITLVGVNVYSNTSTPEDFQLLGAGDSLTITFVGSGLDVTNAVIAGTGTFDVYVDGVNQASLSFNAFILKLCSGLPYGTHVVKLQRTGAGTWGNAGFVSFKVYAPKTPAIPTTARSLGTHYVPANYVANATSGAAYVSQGVLRKSCMREIVYTGSWSLSGGPDTNAVAGWWANSGSPATYEYTFVGTDVNIRIITPNSAISQYVSIDGSTPGSTNFTALGYTTSLVQPGTGLTFAATTGILSGTSSVTGFGASVNISGLANTKHTIKVTYNSGTGMYLEAIDIATPIHFPKVQSTLRQNTLPVGSCSLGDLRKLYLKDEGRAKVRAEAVGVESDPQTTSSSYVPVRNMSVSVDSVGADFLILFDSSLSQITSAAAIYHQIYINGSPFGQEMRIDISASFTVYPGISMHKQVYLPEGTHNIEIYWKTSAATSYHNGRTRTLTVIEL